MEQAPTFRDYVDIVKRRRWYFIVPAIIVLLGSVVAAVAIPPLYRSTGKILVESQQIPSDLVQPTVTSVASQRIAFLQERIMTRSRLTEIIKKFSLYPEKTHWPIAELVDHMRKDIHIEVITDPYDRASQNAIAFTVSFDHKNPKIAHEVADDLVNLFLQENIETRTKRATETTQFLREQAQKLSAQASAIDAKVAKFKQEHSDTLPEHLNLKVDMLNTAQSTVKSLERDIASTEEERRFLLTQRVSGGAMLSTRDGSGHLVLSPRQELVVLKAELAEKSGIYSPSHPDIRSLERRISTLERLVQVKSSDDGLESAANPAKAEIESQIRSAELRLQSMRAQEQDVQQSIKRLQAQIIEIPQVERALKDLTRNYDNAMKEYQAMQAKVQQAQVAQNLEHEKKAERFELLERPTVPVAPVWPKKPQLIGIAFALALGTGGGTVFAAEMLDQSIRGPAMLTSLVGRHPLAVIPYIESLLDQRSTKRKRHMRHLLGSVALLLMVLAGIALLYLLSSPYGRAVPAFG